MRSPLPLRRIGHVRLLLYLAAALGAAALGPKAVLANDEVIGWGDNSSGQLDVWSNLSGVVGIAAGFHHSLALRSDGSVSGWGDDYWGEASGSHWVGQIGIAAGNSFSLSFGGSGDVVGWGQGYNGDVVPGGVGDAVAIAAGSSHALALRANGSVLSFGDYTNVPVVLSNAVAIAAGGSHDLALRADGSIVGWSWGYTDYGEATPPSGLSNVVDIAAGDGFSLGATGADGTVVSWGYTTNVPAGLSNVVAVSAASHSLALRADGTVVGWGNNYYGQTNIPRV